MNEKVQSKLFFDEAAEPMCSSQDWKQNIAVVIVVVVFFFSLIFLFFFFLLLFLIRLLLRLFPLLLLLPDVKSFVQANIKKIFFILFSFFTFHLFVFFLLNLLLFFLIVFLLLHNALFLRSSLTYTINSNERTCMCSS